MRVIIKRLTVITLILLTIASIIGGMDVWACSVAPSRISRLNTSAPPPLVEPTFSEVAESTQEDISTTWAQITENPVGGRVATCASMSTSQQRILFIGGLLSISFGIVWLFGTIIFSMVRKLRRGHEG